MDDFDLTLSNSDVNYSHQVDVAIIKVLMFIRNVIDRGFFFTYYIKEELVDDLHIMVEDVSKLTRNFSFLQLDERDGATLQKREVYSIIQSVNFNVPLEHCIRVAMVFQRITIDNYKSYYDGNMLLEMSEKIIQCILSFKGIKLFTTDKIERYLEEFVVFLLKKIACADMACFTDGAEFISLLTQLLHKYIRLPSIKSVVLRETSSFIIKFNRYYNMKKVKRIEDLHYEILLIFLTVLFEALGATKTESCDFEKVKKGCAIELCEVLKELRSFLPDYFGCHIERSIETLTT